MNPKLSGLRNIALRHHAAFIKFENSSLFLSTSVQLCEFEKYVLVLEDRDFFRHSGVSFKAIAREIWKRLRGKTHGGASTIDMQTYRVYSGRYERTFSRKLNECAGAFLMQFRYSKIQILRSYLSVAYFGTSLTGSDQASQAIFQRRAEDLSGLEAAYLAAMLVYPKPRVSNANWSAKVARRANYGLHIVATDKKKFNNFPNR